MLTVQSQPDYDISHTFNILLYFLTARWSDFDHKAEKLVKWANVTLVPPLCEKCRL